MTNTSRQRTFTPRELSLLCQSPLAAWWNELDRRKLFKGPKLKQDPLNEILKKDGIRHEEKLIKELENQNFKVKDRNGIYPIGFVVGLKNIYLSTSNGRSIYPSLVVVVCCSSGTFLIRFFFICFFEILGPPIGSPYSSLFSPKLYVGLTGLTGEEGLVFVFCNTLVLGDEVFTLVLGDDEVDPFVNTLVLGDGVDGPPFPDVLSGLPPPPFTALTVLTVYN